MGFSLAPGQNVRLNQLPDLTPGVAVNVAFRCIVQSIFHSRRTYFVAAFYMLHASSQLWHDHRLHLRSVTNMAIAAPGSSGRWLMHGLLAGTPFCAQTAAEIQDGSHKLNVAGQTDSSNPAAESSTQRFSQLTDGIADRKQQLVWASADNGSDINWGDAQRYCAAKGSGWTLPSVAALQSLYDASGAHQRNWKMTYEVTTYDVAAKPATPLITISSCCFWSNEAKGAPAAWVVFLDNGDRLLGAVGSGYFGRRALCVRPS